MKIVTPRIQGRDETEEIMKIFELFDEDGSGEITFKKLKRVAVRVNLVFLLCSDVGGGMALYVRPQASHLVPDTPFLFAGGTWRKSK